MSTNPTHLEQQNQTEQQNKAPVSSIRTHSGFTLWLDGLRCKLTVHAWRRRTKKARRHHSFRQVLAFGSSMPWFALCAVLTKLLLPLA